MVLSICLLAVAVPYAHDALTGVNAPYSPRTSLHPFHPELGLEWKMHPIDSPGDWLPNGLDRFDVNGDGYDDYVTNYEWKGRIRVAFHPGPELGESGPEGAWSWHTVDAGRVPNAESAAFGDLDGDGLVDIVVAHGIEHTDRAPGINVLWGGRDSGAARSHPPASEAPVPSSTPRGHVTKHTAETSSTAKNRLSSPTWTVTAGTTSSLKWKRTSIGSGMWRLSMRPYRP